ncbi:MAG: class I SAM-dependent methyltransferase [Anaerolineales bacterium]|jgi:predicted O-methyltransferase YrrM|nr:class I SAM-dependent methyltransferase [Anaerolineales bacterium]
MSNYINHIRWFIKRPELYPELFRTIKKRILGYPLHLNESEKAQEWCEDRAINVWESLGKISGRSSVPNQKVRDIFPKEFYYAEEMVKKCPVTLGGAGSLDLLYWISEFTKAQNVIETGVAYGWSSLVFLLSLSQRDGAFLISTDMPYYEPEWVEKNLKNDLFVGCVVPPEYNEKWLIIRQADREALPKAIKRFGSIDLCHYDSDKTYEGRIWAYQRLWKALRLGGYLISDDISDNLAFRDFGQIVGANSLVVKMSMDANNFSPAKAKYIGIVRKE